METSPDGCETTTSERLETPADVSIPPSLWHGAVSAFRQAQLQRLEARITQLRRRLHSVPTVQEQGVILVAAAPRPHADTGWTAGTSPPRRASSWTAVACILMLVGITLSVPIIRNREEIATAFYSPAVKSQVMPTAREVTELRTLLASLDERVTMLQRQVLQQGDQLTNQAATVLGVTQHGDTQQTQVTALADALAMLTTHVAQLEQRVTTQATSLAAPKQQLAMQTVQREPVRPQTRTMGQVAPVATRRSDRPRPPTLELFAPPSSQTITPLPHLAPSLSAVGAQPPRRSITLPAALGAEGYRAATGTTEGTRP
jgi:hypothetical protein